MLQFPLFSGLSRFDRVLACRDTLLSRLTREGLELARFDPSLLAALDHDIEMEARTAKKVRLMDWQFEQEKTCPVSPLLELPVPSDFDEMDPWEFRLCVGRPRVIDAELLLVLMSVNSALDLMSASGWERLIESEVFAALLGTERRPPSRSTVNRYLLMPTVRTRTLINQAVLRKAKAEGLEDFKEMTLDSTAVEANSAWPTDSGLISGFLNQACGLLNRQAELTGVDCSSALIERWLEKMDGLHKAIAMLPSRPGSVRERRKLYRRLLATAERTHAKLVQMLDGKRDPIEECCVLPGLRLRVDRVMAEVDSSMAAAAKTMKAARVRVLEGGKVAAADRAFSLSDPDAWMIEKGQRDPVLGYKPQIARSANGFITAFEVQPGNPADSTRAVDMVLQHIRNTGRVPLLVSADDGYASEDNLNGLADLEVETVCFSGAKGRALLGEEIWESLADIRKDRSAVESTIFTLKYKCNLRRFCRRGIDGVARDLDEAVLTYNLWRLARCRSQRHAQGGAVAA